MLVKWLSCNAYRIVHTKLSYTATMLRYLPLLSIRSPNCFQLFNVDHKFIALRQVNYRLQFTRQLTVIYLPVHMNTNSHGIWYVRLPPLAYTTILTSHVCLVSLYIRNAIHFHFVCIVCADRVRVRARCALFDIYSSPFFRHE